MLTGERTTVAPTTMRGTTTTPPPMLWVGLAVGALIRLIWLGRQAWFVDEAAEFDVIDRSLVDIATHKDGFPPLSSYVLWLWVELFGQGSARIIPFVAGLATMVLVTFIARRVWDDHTATVVAWLAALSPTLVWTSQELRAYGNFILVTAIAVMLVLRLIERPTTGRYVGLGLMLTLGCFVHYFFPIVVGLLLLWAAYELRATSGFRSGAMLTLAPLAVALVPVALLAFDDLALQQEFSADSAVGSGLAEVGYSSVALLTGATVGPGLRALHDLPASTAVTDMLPWLALLAPMGLLAAWTVWQRRTTDKYLTAFAAMIVLGIGVITALTIVGGTGFRPRYIVWAIVPLVLVLGRTLAVAPRRLAAGAAAALAIVFVVALYNRNYSDEHRVEAIDEVIDAIEASDHPDAPMHVTAGMHLVADLYTEPGNAIILPGLSRNRGLDEAIGDFVEAAGDEPVWIVYSRPFDHDPNRALLRALLDAGAELEQEFAGAKLYFYDAGDPQ